MDVKYNIYLATSANGPWSLVNESPIDDNITGLNEYTISGLIHGTTYHVKIVGGYVEDIHDELDPIFLDHFNIDSRSGWTLVNCTLDQPSNSIIRFTSYAYDPHMRKSFSFDGGENPIIQLRYNVVSGAPGLHGEIFYTTSGHSYSGSYYKNVVLNQDGEWHTLDIDMSSLTAGGSDWINNTITAIRFDWVDEYPVILDIDWIQIGYYREVGTFVPLTQQPLSDRPEGARGALDASIETYIIQFP